MPESVRIAIVGAESTGKTTLARTLAEQLASLTGMRCAWVPEVLRAWCDERGRTPRADEQLGIAMAQQQAIDAAAALNDLVVCDTTPLMTAVYSRLLFEDRSLEAMAAQAHRQCRLTLLTALDIEWASDGHQRDGPHVREPVDAHLRALMAANGIGWSMVSGRGPARLESALDAATSLLADRLAPPHRRTRAP